MNKNFINLKYSSIVTWTRGGIPFFIILKNIKSLRTKLLNAFSLMFILYILYKLIIGFTKSSFYALIISTIIFFILHTFVLNNIKYSKYIIVKLLQKFFIYNIAVIIVFLIYGVIFSPEIHCLGEMESKNANDSSNSNSNNGNNIEGNRKESVKADINVKEVLEGGSKKVYEVHLLVDKDNTDRLATAIVKEGIGKYAPALGGAAAGGKAAAAAINATGGMPIVQRGVVVGGAAFVAATGAALGVNVAQTIMSNKSKKEEIQKNINEVLHNQKDKGSSTEIDRIPSPDNNFINSPFEENIPLVVLINTIFTFNLLEILLVFIFLLVLFNKYFYKLNINIMSKITDKFKDNIIIDKFKNYMKYSAKYNDKFAFIMIIIISILFILIKLTNLLIVLELNNNIDDYVLVYNHYKNISSSIDKEYVIYFIVKIKPIFRLNRIMYNNFLWSIQSIFCFLGMHPLPIYKGSPLGISSAYKPLRHITTRERRDSFAVVLYNFPLPEKGGSKATAILSPCLVASGRDSASQTVVKGVIDVQSIVSMNCFAITVAKPKGLFAKHVSQLGIVKMGIAKYSTSSTLISATQTKDGLNSSSEALNSKDTKNIIEVIDRDSQVIAKNLYEYLTTINDLLPLYSSVEQDKDREVQKKISSIFETFLRYYKLSGIKSKELNKIHDNYRLNIKNIRKGKVNYKYNDDLKRDYPYVWQVLNNFEELIVKNNIRPLRDKYMSNFINSAIKLINLDNKYEDYIINICDSVDNDVKEVLKNKTKRADGRLNPNRLKGLTPTDYSKLIWLKLLQYSSDMDSKFLNILKNRIDIINKKGESKNTQLLLEIEDKLKFLFDIRDQILLIRPFHLKKLDYERESMQNVAARHELLLKVEDTVNIEMLKDLHKDRDNYNQFLLNLENKNSFSRENKYAEDGLLYSIKNILSLNNLSLEDKQLSIEKLCLSNDQNWFERELQAMKDSTNYSVESIMLHDLYKSTINNLTIILNRYINNNFSKLKKGLLNKDNDSYAALIMISLGPNLVLNLGFTDAIKAIMKDYEYGVNQTQLMSSVGSLIINQMKWMYFEDTMIKKNILQIMVKNQILKGKKLEEFANIYIQNINYLVVNDAEYDTQARDNCNILIPFNIGQTIVSLLLSKDKVFKRNFLIVDNKTSEVLITLNPNYEHKMNISLMSSTHLPMLVKPNSPDKDGYNYLPYLTGEVSHIMNTYDRLVKDNYKNKYPTENIKVLVKTMESLNNVKFKINQIAFKIFIEEWNRADSLLFKGYNKKLNIEDNDSSIVKNEKKGHNSIYWQYFNILQIADLYLNYTFYLPTFADFRGRIYCFSPYLSYQGNDLARALLLFDEGNNHLTVEGLTYIKIYFSNLAGQDKESWNDKIKWADNNISKIYSKLLSDNVNSLSLIRDLKEPFQFIAILLALGKYNLEDREGLKIKSAIYNPILFDASCNGIQHLASMTRDIELAIKTNVLYRATGEVSQNREATPPEDLYSFAAELVQKELPKEGVYSNINITRKFVKKSVMTIPYNISLIGVQNQIREHTKYIKELNKHIYVLPSEFSKENKEIHLTLGEVNKLGSIIYKVLNQDLPSLKLLKDYLDSMVNILLKLGLWIYWLTPNGLKVNLSTVKFKSYVLKSRLYSGNKPITITLPTKELDKLAIKRSLMPNLIHSLDATNIQLFINKVEKSIPFYTIHDCFASLPNNMPYLEFKVKEAFIEIYFKDINYVVMLHQQLIHQIKSAAVIGTDSSGQEYITILSKKNKNEIQRIKIPQLPKAFTNKKLNQYFIDGLHNSRYFIG
jgi:DNA-directed RNA polymerase